MLFLAIEGVHNVFRVPGVETESGFAGLHPAKKQRQGIFASRRHSRSSKAACAGRVAGPAAYIVDAYGGRAVPNVFDTIHPWVVLIRVRRTIRAACWLSHKKN